MQETWLEILRQDQAAGAVLAIVQVAIFYVIAKSSIWWILFGTGRLLFRKYTLKEWGFRTLVGIVGLVCLGLFVACLLWLYDADSIVYWTILCVSLFFSLRIWLREILSLFGLLRGDWNPFHPRLRFMAWNETYIFRLFGNGKSDSNDDCVWGKSMDRAYKTMDLHWAQNEGLIN